MHPLARLAGMFLAIIIGESMAGSGPALAPGVSLELAEQRAALLSNINYRLHLDIPAGVDDSIGGRVEISFDLSRNDQGLQLDFRESADKLHSLKLNGAITALRFEQEHILLDGGDLAVGRNRIEIGFTAGDSSLNRNPEYLYSLFVPDRARTAFPLFDQPDLKAIWELSLAIPEDWTAVANQPVLKKRNVSGKTEYQFAPSKPVSSYLFSFVAGRFETVTRTIGKRPMTLYHRETDAEKVERNLDAIFGLHGEAIEWLQNYTGVPLPFEHFDFVLVPAFQYSGMEHPGAVLYRASTLLLDPEPSDPQLLKRARLIAHETAHMWFGNLVTMRWFDDVWTKEVFANFMADKMVNPVFPSLDHDLNFLVKHYPKAYAVDRSEGANPIRQTLPNLNEAGQMYGNVIYDKAPIMMRQLELVAGPETFRAGLSEYLRRFSFGTASWPELVAILDKKSETDLVAWSRIWVETPGRPLFQLADSTQSNDDNAALVQSDPTGGERLWPQQFSLLTAPVETGRSVEVRVNRRITDLAINKNAATNALLNADGYGYGLFPTDMGLFREWGGLAPLARGSLLVNSYENLLEGSPTDPDTYLAQLLSIVSTEQDQLLLDLALTQMARVFWQLLSEEQRARRAAEVEQVLWRAMSAQKDGARKKLLFQHLEALASSTGTLGTLHDLWSGKREIEGLTLEETDRIRLAQILAIGLPERATDIIDLQLKNTSNPDHRRRLEFVAPALSADPRERDRFFYSLEREKNRGTEQWVVEALSRLHHPTRTAQSQQYLLPGLELLQEIQVTGDIFFPSQWLRASLAFHASPEAAKIVRSFLAARPDYNRQLRMKILQEADPLFRACRIRTGNTC